MSFIECCTESEPDWQSVQNGCVSSFLSWMNVSLGSAAAAVTKHHDRGGDGVSLVGGMIKIQNLKYRFYGVYHFHTITKSKNFKMNHHNSE